MHKRAAIYVRVSTDKQTVENQVTALRQIAERRGWDVVEQYSDAGISGAKGRDGRPGLDQMLKDASRRKFDVIMAWSIDRVGRSLIDLLGTIQTLEACGVDLYLDQQSIDTTTPAGKLMFQVCGAFAEFERSMIRQRINAGLKRAVAQGKQLGRPKVDPAIEKRIQAQLRLGKGMQRSRVSAASAPARCSALSRRWKALSSARPREADGTQMKPKRPNRPAPMLSRKPH
jgi:DNA invertase Pin-like site-specific DNA recombinase